MTLWVCHVCNVMCALTSSARVFGLHLYPNPAKPNRTSSSAFEHFSLHVVTVCLMFFVSLHCRVHRCHRLPTLESMLVHRMLRAMPPSMTTTLFTLHVCTAMTGLSFVCFDASHLCRWCQQFSRSLTANYYKLNFQGHSRIRSSVMIPQPCYNVPN
jgi:hypothetical protein